VGDGEMHSLLLHQLACRSGTRVRSN
jgi:hypothetical protein